MRTLNFETYLVDTSDVDEVVYKVGDIVEVTAGIFSKPISGRITCFGSNRAKPCFVLDCSDRFKSCEFEVLLDNVYSIRLIKEDV